ncbi:MAG TPA: glycoside hydrolase family 13 protein [Tenuifilaceae bacterium]|nr:glycoside hydrolase family 13 protein [Tenuifilaceae bacterium]
MRKLAFTLLLTTLISVQMLNSQTINRVEPPNWWIGMKNSELQLLVHGNDISNFDVELNYAGVKVVDVVKVESPNYLFINLELSADAKAGNFDILFKSPEKELKYTYSLLERREGSAERTGFDASDVIYLLFPDRFANGNSEIDEVEGMLDKLDRSDLYARHGGDIQGIINHLDYIHDLGMTAIWVNPLLESNQSAQSYHGYATTDFYNIDKRFGTNELYKEFVEQTHGKNMKVIMDMIFNHCGSNHWWMNDLPENDWVNQWPEFTRTNYRSPTNFDPYASKFDSKLMSDGWFDTHMPDMNQRNPLLAKYLIQNSIWWVEFANLDGIRMDTHPYPDKEFMARWAREVMNEYPNFNIVSEVWLNYPAWCAYWQTGANNSDKFDSGVKSVMDFPLMYAIDKGLQEKEGWDTGLHRLYEILASDFLYPDPMNILIFADNHDVSRFMKSKDMAIGRFKLGMAFLLTTRGIPQIYYGTEIMMDGDDVNGHGVLRQDFPGGWASDKRSAFTADGRTKRENEAWSYLQTILTWRKTASAIHSGKLIHFIPENEVYVYFRQNSEQTIMVILHSGYQPKVLKTSRFNEVLEGFTDGIDIITGKSLSDISQIQLSPRSAMIIELKK